MQNFTPPAQQTRLIGHADAQAAFLTAWEAGRMPHAWLLTGAAGIGKATFAYHAARWVLAPDRPQGNLVLQAAHRLYAQIAADACPGLLAISPAEGEKGTPLAISVSQVRGGKDSRTNTRYKGISEFLQLTVADGGWRVVLIDGAELLNEQAQNAVLKILEEPPAQTLLLLICDQPGRLLPTIRSRCRQLRMTPLDSAQLRALAATSDMNLPDTSIITRANGSIGELARLASLDAGKLDHMLQPLLDGVCDPHWRVDWQGVHELATMVSKKGAEAQFDLLLELLLGRLTQLSMQNPALSRDADKLQKQMNAVREKYLQPNAALLEIFGSLQKLSIAAGQAA